MKIKIRTSSAEIVASIDDLLSQILLCLPLKSLVCFKSVSKHWHFLITLLRRPSPNPAVGLFLHHSFPYTRSELTFEYFSFSINQHYSPSPKLDFIADPAGIGILQSSNGLLLCCSYLNYRDKRYYICNPTTKRFLQLPIFQERAPKMEGVSLAFDPTKSPHYKVVCVFLGTNDFEFAIYSSKTRSWRKCAEPFSAKVCFKKGVYWNGAIHWVSFSRDGSLYLNLDDNMPKRLRMPPIQNGYDWRFHYYLGESCDHLHYIEFFKEKLGFDVYEMKRDYSEWFVKYRVDLSPVVASYPVMYMDGYDPTTMWYPSGFWITSLVRGVKEEDSFLLLHIPGEMVRYNLVNGAFETVYVLEGAEIDVVQGWVRYVDSNGHHYIESLSSVYPDPLLF